MIGILLRFFKFTGDQRGHFTFSIFTSIIHAIFEAIRIPAIAIVITALVEGNVTMSTVWSTLIIMLISIAGCAVTRRSMTIRQTIGGYTVAANKRVEIGERLKYMPMGYFNNNSLGDITSVATNTCEALQDVAARVIMITVHGLLATAIIAISVLIYDWRIGLIVIAGILLFLLVNSIMQKKSNRLSPRKTKSDTKLVGAVLEYIQGIAVVRSYNLDQTANKTVNDAIKDNENINFDMEKGFIPYICIQSFILKLFSIIIVLASISFYLGGTMDIITCLLMMVASYMIYGELESAGSFSSLLRVMDLSMDKINAIFDTPTMDIDGRKIVPAATDIEGKNVVFAYEKQRIIDDVSFSIPQGTTTAVVGPSGSGKTTLCHLMARFWDVNSGRITLGGDDVKDYTLDSLLKNYSMVFQSVYLFNDTIANNIKFGNPNDSMESVIEAAKKACCHEFISLLPDGYDTVIGEGGATISGGEKQRISIARALLKNSPIIILDEATANVDPENEKQLQMAIEELTRNKTIIMIAHRLKTVEHADQILVIDDGKIVQKGTHSELIRRSGIYADFVGSRKQAIGWKIAKQ